jgi:hypothetical protein
MAIFLQNLSFQNKVNKRSFYEMNWPILVYCMKNAKSGKHRVNKKLNFFVENFRPSRLLSLWSVLNLSAEQAQAF